MHENAHIDKNYKKMLNTIKLVNSEIKLKTHKTLNIKNKHLFMKLFVNKVDSIRGSM